MRVEFGRGVLARGHAIVIATNRDGVEFPNCVDCFDRIGAVTDDVAAAENLIVAAKVARCRQASRASILEWMSLRTKKRIVYDVFDATSPES
jgi:hypothetical protein